MNLISLHSCPRSGSTWVQSIFESHPNIKTIYQPLFSYAFKNIINENSTKSEFDRFIDKLSKTSDEFCNMKTNYHTNNKQTDIIRYSKEKTNIIFMKHVHHHNLIETFIKLNSNIKIVGLIRDPRAVICSQISAKNEKLVDWLNGSDKNENKKECFFGFNKWLEVTDIFYYIKKKYPNNIIIVKYENLVKNTNEEINKICVFCNIKSHKNMENSIKLMNSKNEEYDYSVFKNKDTLNTWKNNLNNKIVKYINLNKYRVAICVCVNDIKNAKGTGKNGIKSKLSYIQQFLMLYYSIKENWKFNYKIYLFHSFPIKELIIKKLKKLDINIIKIDTQNLLIRPESYLIDIDCDYRLVLDCDMIAINNPDFLDFKYDAYAMYGSFNYQFLLQKYPNLFKILNLNKTNVSDFIIHQKKNKNMHGLWSNININIINDFLKNNNNINNKRFYPVFNHGAILVNNLYSKQIGEKLLLYKKKFNTNNGQNVIGYIINSILKDKWSHFDRGFNLYINEKHATYPIIQNYLNNENNKLYLLHYINISKKSQYFKKYINKYYNMISV